MAEYIYPEHTQESVLLSEYLDEYGYSAERRTARITRADKLSEALTLATRHILNSDKIDKIFVGSTREGIALNLESDIDILQINSSVFCYENNDEITPYGTVGFYLDHKSAPPGYVFLRLDKSTETNTDYLKTIDFALKEKCGEKYFSSERYMNLNEDVFYNTNGNIGRKTVYRQRKGPSIPKNTEKGFIEKMLYKLHGVNLNQDCDFVRAFPCYCPGLIETWCTRPRENGWPSKATIDQVLESEIYVVPVGKANTEDEDLQWRISCVQAEMCLVKSFNDTQAKVHILLRHITRQVLTPICEDITSYVVKNVMFWLAEEISTDDFQESFLIERLVDGLKRIKTCIVEKNLRNFMNPDLNMFNGKLNSYQDDLIQELNYILDSCDRCLLDVIDCVYIESETPDLYEHLQGVEQWNDFDAIESDKSSVLNTRQTADYMIAMYNSSNELQMQLYHLYYIQLSFIWKKIRELPMLLWTNILGKYNDIKMMSFTYPFSPLSGTRCSLSARDLPHRRDDILRRKYRELSMSLQVHSMVQTSSQQYDSKAFNIGVIFCICFCALMAEWIVYT